MIQFAKLARLTVAAQLWLGRSASALLHPCDEVTAPVDRPLLSLLASRSISSQMIHSGNKTTFKTTFVIDDGTKPYSYTITKPAKSTTATAATRATASAAAPTASGLEGQGHGGIGAMNRSDHGNSY